MMNSRTRAEEQKDSRCGHHISSLNKNLNSFHWLCPLPGPRGSDGCQMGTDWRWRSGGDSSAWSKCKSLSRMVGSFCREKQGTAGTWGE